jgi:hypothetical protein
MRLGVLFIVLGITGFSLESRADILTIRQDVVALDGASHAEVTTFLTENAADRREVVARLKKSLAEDFSGNPALLTGFENLATEKVRSPSSTGPNSLDEIEKVAAGRPVIHQIIPEATLKTLESRYPEWFVNHSRIIFSVSRTVINSSVATWSLMVTHHLPFQVAVSAGVLTGGMSGGVQYANQYVQKYLTTSLTEKLAKGEGLRKGVAYVESVFRWYLMEIGFISSVQIALAAMGHPSGTLTAEIGVTALTALKTVAAQGLWDIAISRVTKRNTLLAETDLAKKMIRFRSDFMTLGLSALSVTGMVATLSGMPLGKTIFWGMGITGAVYFLKITYNEWKCKQLMKAAENSKTSTIDPLSPAQGGGDSGDDSSTTGLEIPSFE